MAQDDPRESAQASASIESLTPGQPGFITDALVVESAERLWRALAGFRKSTAFRTI